MELGASPPETDHTSPLMVGDSWDEAEQDWARSSLPTTLAIPPGSCLRKFQDLKKVLQQGERLKPLKARIRLQQRRCLLRARGEPGMLGVSPPRNPASEKTCLETKVRKVASVAAPRAVAGQKGWVLKKQQPRGTIACPLPEKAHKKKAAQRVGASTWREGQKLARQILGPPLTHPKSRKGSEWGPSEPTRHGELDQGGQGLGGNGRAVSRVREKIKEEKGNQWFLVKESPRGSQTRSSSDNLIVEKRTPHGQKAAGIVELGRSRGSPDEATAEHCPSAPGRPSTARTGQRRGPSQRSPISSKENQPTCHNQAARWRKDQQSHEEIHEFMNQKWAERNRRTRESKLALKQAQEERDARLREVYRKQKEAFRRRKGGMEALHASVVSTTWTEDTPDLEWAREKDPRSGMMGWHRQSSEVLLRNGAKLHSDLDWETTRTTEGAALVDSPLVAGHRSTLESFLPSQKPVVGLLDSMPRELKPTLPPSPTKQERVAALQVLAQDLSQRLDREMGNLELANRSWGRRGPSSGAPTLPEFSLLKPDIPRMNAVARLDGGAFWEQSFSQTPSTDAGKTREKMEGRDGLSAHHDKTSLGGNILRCRSSEEKPVAANKTDLEEVHKGFAADEGFQWETNVFQGESRPSLLMAIPQSPPERHIICSQAKDDVASHQTAELQDDGVEDHFALHPGQGSPLQSQPCAPSSLPLHVPHAKTSFPEEPAEGSGPTDSASQWSEIGQFYGASRTFGHFGLSMVEQSLREEELRARHQAALLRLREKALQEKTKAELAWLDHRASCRKSSGVEAETPASLEKRSALLIELKQEQAEIWHLRNLCRASHQERKLLLKQQKELLALQQATAQLWRRLWEESAKSPQQLRTVPNKDTNDASHAGRPRDRKGLQKGKEKDGLSGEKGEISPRGKWTKQEFLNQKPWLETEPPETMEGRDKGMNSFRNQPVDPTVTENAVSKPEEAQHGEDTLWRKCCADDADRPSGEKPGGLDFVMPWAERPHFSAHTELGLEFHRARAVLVSISGSSSLASNLEAEDSQDTDVSLPEEFAIPEELADLPRGTSGNAPATSEERPRNTLSPGGMWHTAGFNGGSNRHPMPVPCSQKKATESVLAGERIYSEGKSGMGAINGSQKLSPLRTRGAPSMKVLTSASGRNPEPLNLSRHEPSTEGCGAEELASQPATESVAWTDVPCHSMEEEPRCARPGAALGRAEGTWNAESPPPFRKEPTACTPVACLKTTESFSDNMPSDSSQSFFSLSHNPTTLSESENRANPEKGLANESLSTGGDNGTTQRPRVSRNDEDSSLQCPESSERITQGSGNCSLGNGQNTKESGTAQLHLSTSEAQLLFPAQSCLLRSKSFGSEVEDEIVSPVDEILSYGSANLSSGEDASSFQVEDLPPPPQDLKENKDEATSSFQDFPPPPGDVLASLEAEGLPYALEEEVSVETDDLPSLEDHNFQH